MKLSIIIPVLNEEKHISVLLKYLLNYSNEKTEIIVVDGILIRANDVVVDDSSVTG
jgi:glycosyltransferase involved in cell wall biosynthesis